MWTRSFIFSLLLVGCFPSAPSRFLSADGVGSEEEAEAYYEALDPPIDIDTFTLFDFENRYFEDLPVNEAFYRNSSELGFWREMRCTTVVDRGRGACLVTNWGEREQRDNLGTVGMRIDDQGRTQFYAFNAGGELSPFVELDNEGEKYVPRVCTSCHAGGYSPLIDGVDTRSVFREFEPSELEAPRAFVVPALNEQWLALNKTVLRANESVRDARHAEQQVRAHVEQIYVSQSPPVARALDDPAHAPPSWREDAARHELWRKVVQPYCMSCHRTSPIDFTSYAVFEGLAPVLRDYLDPEPEAHEKTGLPFMPQSERQFRKLNDSYAARTALSRWLRDNGEPLPPVANAGSDLVVTAGEPISIAALYVDDANHYRWEFRRGPWYEPIEAASFELIAPSVDEPTTMRIELSVADAADGWAGDAVEIVILPGADVATGTTP